MKIGMTLRVTEPGWSRGRLTESTKRIDRGPYSSLALRERTRFPNPELMTTLTWYLNGVDPAARTARITKSGFRGSPRAFEDRLPEIADTGVDELLMMPKSIESDEIERVSNARASR